MCSPQGCVVCDAFRLREALCLSVGGVWGGSPPQAGRPACQGQPPGIDQREISGKWLTKVSQLWLTGLRQGRHDVSHGPALASTPRAPAQMFARRRAGEAEGQARPPLDLSTARAASGLPIERAAARAVGKSNWISRGQIEPPPGAVCAPPAR